MSHTIKALKPRNLYKENSIDSLSAEKVVGAFNTWAFKREKPSDLDLLNAFVGSAVADNRRIQFTLYWGKGPRSSVCTPELNCLKYLSSLAGRVKQVYPPGAVFDLVFTDTHARLNGHNTKTVETYFQDVISHADPELFRSHRLSRCVRACKQEMDVTETPTPTLLDKLEKSASKWFAGEGTPRQAAANYFAMNMRERRAIEECFPASIFVTFNGSAFRDLFPTRLPVFYMYSVKKGVAIKPWFLPDPESNGDVSTLPRTETVAAA